MGENLNDGIHWIKIVYPDSSVRIFRGTRDLAICRDFGINELEYMEILDVGKRKVVYVPPSAEITVSELQPEYERGVDRFASRFI